MDDNYLTLSKFNVEGQFVGFVSDITGKFKYLQLASGSGDVQIKIPKELRLPLSLSLEPGEQIRVVGVSKLDSSGTVKLKAYKVKPIGFCSIEHMSLQQEVFVEHTNVDTGKAASHRGVLQEQSLLKAKIIVCQKSGCLKRGGRGLLSELAKTLRDRGLQDYVTIDYSSTCLKCCKSAPNYILQIGNKQYKNIHPNQIVSLLENILGR